MQMDLFVFNYNNYAGYSFNPVLNTNTTPPDVPFGDYCGGLARLVPPMPAPPPRCFASTPMASTRSATTGTMHSVLFDAPDYERLVHPKHRRAARQTVDASLSTNAIATNVYHFTVTASIGQQRHSPGRHHQPHQRRGERSEPADVHLAGSRPITATRFFTGLNFGYDLPVSAATSFSGVHARMRALTASRWILITFHPLAWSVRCRWTAPPIPSPVGFPPGRRGIMPTSSLPSARWTPRVPAHTLGGALHVGHRRTAMARLRARTAPAMATT